MSNPISFSTLTSLTYLTDFNKKCCTKIIYWLGFVLFLYSLVERTRGSLVRASTSGLCRKERHKFEPRSTRDFLSVESILYCIEIALISIGSFPQTIWLTENRQKRKSSFKKT